MLHIKTPKPRKQPNIFEAPPLTIFESPDGKEFTFRGGGEKDIIVNISFHDGQSRAWLIDPRHALEGMENFKIVGTLSPTKT